MPARGSPTADYLEKQRDAQRQRYETRNNHILDIRAWRRDEKKPNIPAAFADLCTIYHPPDVAKLIDAGQALIAKKLPTTHRVPTDLKSVKARNTAELIERWFKAAHLRTLNDIKWWAQVTDSLAEGPLGVWKSSLRKHAWGEALKQFSDLPADEYNKKVERVRQGHFPFVVTHVPSLSYMPMAWDGYGKLTEVMELTERERPLLADLYGDKLKGAGVIRDGDAESWGHGTVECFEYWNRDTCIFQIEDERVYEGTHKTGRPPYYAAQFSTTGHHDPSFQSRCLVDPILSALELFQMFLAEKSTWSQMTHFPGWKLVKTDPDALPYAEEFKIVWGPNVTTKPPDGYDWVPLVAPGTGQDLNQTLAFLKDTIDKNSLADILYGEGSGEMSGPVQQNAIQLAHATFGTAMQNLAQAVDEMDHDWLYLIDHDIKAPVPVMVKANGEWLEIGPDDIEEFYDVENILEPIIKMAEVVEYTQAADQQAKGYVTKDYVRRLIPGVENPEEMADAVYVEKMEESNQEQALAMAQYMELVKADEQPPPPTVEEITGQPVPRQGTPPGAPPGVMAGNMAGAGVVAPPGMGNQPVNPGMQPALRPG